tara:strand:- start:1020 stop:2636 length:1617 start_codon:yes stop_codon:yes gene_type:complete
VAPQEVLLPGSTPPKNGRRFLLWNLVGMISSREEPTYSAVEVEFSDAERHRTLRLTDHYSFSIAALDHAAVAFASRSNNGNPSTLVYRPLTSWAPNSEWQVQLGSGEEALALALGHKFAVLATSARYLRIYSHTGAPRALLCYSSPLKAVAAAGGLLALVTHATGAPPIEGGESLTLCLYDLREPGRPVRLSTAPLPLTAGATLDWIGFSELGALSSVDSTGVVRQCLRSVGFDWVPLLHGASLKKSKAEHHWIVGLTEAQLMCVICKGDDKFPPLLPRPVMSALPFAMPLACAEPSDPPLESSRLLSQLGMDEFRVTAEDEGVSDATETKEQLLRTLTKLDSVTIKLMAAAAKSERNARCLDLAMQLQLPKSLAAALKLANHYKLGPLAERITRLLEAKHDDAVLDEDLEVAPARAPLPTRVREPQQQQQPADKGEDAPQKKKRDDPYWKTDKGHDENAEAMEEEQQQEEEEADDEEDAPKASLNPFARAGEKPKASAPFGKLANGENKNANSVPASKGAKRKSGAAGGAPKASKVK